VLKIRPHLSKALSCALQVLHVLGNFLCRFFMYWAIFFAGCSCIGQSSLQVIHVLGNFLCRLFMYWAIIFAGSSCIGQFSLQVLHVLGNHLCDAPSGGHALPLHGCGHAQHRAGKWCWHAHAAVHNPARRLCHHQTLHPPLGSLVRENTTTRLY